MKETFNLEFTHYMNNQASLLNALGGKMEKLKEIIGDAKTIGIAGHIRPDGDCVGSCMAIYNYILNNFPEVEVKVYLEYVDNKFRIIKNTDKIITTGFDGTVFDLFITMDSADLERIGINGPFFKSAKRTACIDHHVSNRGYADFNYILPNASSASEVLFDLLEEKKIDQSVAEAMYMGIAHDSGCFRYSSTSPKTMMIAAKLMERDIDITHILEETYYKKTYEQQQITGRLLLESIRFMDNQCIFSYATTKMMNFYGVTTNDLDGVVSELRNVEGVECAVFMYQTGELEYKVSMRSNRIVDVSKIAVGFGGGGHIHASGFNASGTVHDIINNVSREIEKQMQ